MDQLVAGVLQASVGLVLVQRVISVDGVGSFHVATATCRGEDRERRVSHSLFCVILFGNQYGVVDLLQTFRFSAFRRPLSLRAICFSVPRR